MAETNNPQLQIEVKYSDTKSEQNFKRMQQKIEQQAQLHEQKLLQIQQTANVKKDVSNETFIQKQIQAQIRQDQKIENMWNTHKQRMLMAQEKAQAKMVAGQQSWSSKMTSSMNTVVNSIKGFISAYIGMRGIGLIGDTISWAGEVDDLARSFGMSIKELLNFQLIAQKAGLEVESINRLVLLVQSTLEKAKLGDAPSIKKLKEMGIETGDTWEVAMQKLIDSGGRASLFFDRKLLLDFKKLQTNVDDFSKSMDNIKVNEEAIKNLAKFGDIVDEVTLKLKLWTVEEIDETGKAVEWWVRFFNTIINGFEESALALDEFDIKFKNLQEISSGEYTFSIPSLTPFTDNFNKFYNDLSKSKSESLRSTEELVTEEASLQKKYQEHINNLDILIEKHKDDAEFVKQSIKIKKEYQSKLNETDKSEKTYIQTVKERIDTQNKLIENLEKEIFQLKELQILYANDAIGLSITNKELEEKLRLLKIAEIYKNGIEINIDVKMDEINLKESFDKLFKENPIKPFKFKPGENILADMESEGEKLVKLIELRDKLSNMERPQGTDEDRAKSTYLDNAQKKVQEEINYMVGESGDAFAQIENVTAGFFENFAENYVKYQIAITQGFTLIQAGFDSYTESLQNELAVQQELIRLEQEKWQLRSDAMIEAGIENTAYYKIQVKDHERLMKQLEAKEYQLKGKSWEAEQKARIAGVVMNTAQAIMAAWTIVPSNPLLSGIMTGLVTAMGATQVATVAGQQNPYKKRNLGGWIPGQGFGDSVNTSLTPGEFVVNRESARQNAKLLEMINQGKDVREGGTTNVSVNINGNLVGNSEWVQNDLIPEINKAIRNGYQVGN